MLVNQKAANYQSISISGHKFFGIDSPCGLFITTREVYDNQASFDVAYLNANMRMINCSRSGVEPLKFWWLLKTVGIEGWTEQAAAIMENTAYLVSELTRIGWPCWNNKYSNTVFFKRPNSEIVSKFNLANSYDERFGGNLSHVVVMQHVKKEVIDKFIAELESTKTAVSSIESNIETKENQEYSLAGIKVASGGKKGVAVSKGRKRLSSHSKC